MNKDEIRRVGKAQFDHDRKRYELRKGDEKNAPLCPFGNHFEWVGFDLQESEYVRFTKSVFKVLVSEKKS